MENEDTSMKIILKIKKTGFYVDVGCIIQFIEIIHYLLHKKRWNGVNIDTSQFSIDLFNYMRPNDLNYNCAISNKDEDVKLYLSKRT